MGSGFFEKILRRFGKILPPPHFLQPSKKVWGGGGIFDPYLCFFLHFLENYPPKSEFLVSMGRTGCGKLPALAATPEFLNFFLEPY